MITNVSFDLWMTLIRSHPQFKQRRAELLANTFNSKGLSVSQIDGLMRERDKVFDRYNELTGAKIPAVNMYLDILKRMSINPNTIMLQNAEEFERQSEQLFIEYCPIFMNDEVPSVLKQLVAEGKVLNLASNTGYIEGRTLRIVLEKLKIIHLFSFCVFSDEVKASKPSPAFFQCVQKQSGVPKEQILHIGDNPKTDYKGATDFGFSAMLINKNNFTIDDIKSRLAT